MKKILLVLVCMVLSGCSHKKGIFEKSSDTLHKSPCAKCSKKPFYINGHWVKK